MRVALCQLNTAWEDKEANKKRISRIVAGVRTDWLVFPEMALTGFSMNARATELSRADIEFFRSLARRKRAAVTFGGVLKNRNCSVTFDSGGRKLCQYSKIHLFSLAHENKHFEPGTAAKSFRFTGLRVSPLVCYDLRFPYVFRMSADIFVIIANWPSARVEHWTTLLRARAIENQAFVIGVNRVGRDPNVSYPGNSMVVEPDGSVALKCGGKEGVFEVAIDTSKVECVRKSFPVLKDFRRV